MAQIAIFTGIAVWPDLEYVTCKHFESPLEQEINDTIPPDAIILSQDITVTHGVDADGDLISTMDIVIWWDHK